MDCYMLDETCTYSFSDKPEKKKYMYGEKNIKKYRRIFWQPNSVPAIAAVTAITTVATHHCRCCCHCCANPQSLMSQPKG